MPSRSMLESSIIFGARLRRTSAHTLCPPFRSKRGDVPVTCWCPSGSRIRARLPSVENLHLSVPNIFQGKICASVYAFGVRLDQHHFNALLETYLDFILE